MSRTEAIILAGGQGVRMRSNQPKSLQELGGQPIIQYIVNCAKEASFDRIHVIHSEAGYKIRELFPTDDINWIIQSSPLGTGHAVQQAIPDVDINATVCILYGDIPFIQSQTVIRLLELANSHSLALLTAVLDEPTGYGRIKRDRNGVLKQIIEERDTSPADRTIKEVNAGPMAAKAEPLARWLKLLDNNNSQSEYYLTDIIRHAVSDGIVVATCEALDPLETVGVNSRIDQARLERALQLNQAQELMLSGLHLVDPARFDLRGKCTAGKDCSIDANVILEGQVELADGVQIASNCVIRDSVLGPGVEVRPHTLIEGAEIGAGCTVGPFARIRRGTIIGKNSRVGNYVEIKASVIGEDTKISHLAYIGDARIGNNVNIGAGVITCNFDGKKKNSTFIGDHAFVGSNSALIAPLEIQDYAFIGAGSTISKNVNSGELVVERAKVRTMKNKQAHSGEPKPSPADGQSD